jgi:hypothetical protein
MAAINIRSLLLPVFAGLSQDEVSGSIPWRATSSNSLVSGCCMAACLLRIEGSGWAAGCLVKMVHLRECCKPQMTN